MAETTLWFSLLLIAYSYVVYPLFIRLSACLFGSESDEPAPLSDEELPGVSLVVAAYNEEHSIGERVRNALASDYPSKKLEVLIGSDGSTDGTNQIVAGIDDPRVRLLGFQDRGGKASVLNRSAPEATGEVLVFSDANTHFEPSALRELVGGLVGGRDVTTVCGKLVLTDPQGGTNVDGLYWRYESAIKRAEGRLGAVLGANGGIYALRKEHYVPLPLGTITDDFVEPLLAKLRHGGRIVYRPQAVAHEQTPPTIGAEFARRARIGAGNYQSLAFVWPLLLPWWGWSAVAFFSHKLVRWLTPWLLLASLVANIILAASSLGYTGLLICQFAFYLAAAIGAKTRGGGALGKLLRLATMFTGMNAALAVGCWRCVSGRASGVWGRTTREADHCPP